ncbi:MAG: thioredoxin [Planctomycetota bacterium]
MSEQVAELSESNFQQEAVESETPVLVDFWAPWCGPCRAMTPAIEQLATKHDGKLKVVKVNVDENQSLAVKFNVTAVPTLVLIKGGQTLKQTVGGKSLQDLETFVSDAL